MTQPDGDLIEVDEQEPRIRDAQSLLNAVHRGPGEPVRRTARRLTIEEHGNSYICLGHVGPPVADHAVRLSTESNR